MFLFFSLGLNAQKVEVIKSGGNYQFLETDGTTATAGTTTAQSIYLTKT